MRFDKYGNVSEHLKSDLDRHVKSGGEVTGLTQALLENNLKESFARADDFNVQHMHEIVKYLYNEIPAACWGSPEKVEAWKRRMETAHVQAEIDGIKADTKLV